MPEINATISAFSDINLISDFLIPLTAIIIGVGGGIGGALWQERKKKRHEMKETKLRTVNSILDELKDNRKGLKEHGTSITWEETQEKFEGHYGLSSMHVFESTVSTGNFLLIDLELQAPLSTSYQSFEIWNGFMKQVMDFATYKYPPSSIREQAQILINRLNSTRSDLLPKLDDLITKLEKLKSKLDS